MSGGRVVGMMAIVPARRAGELHDAVGKLAGLCRRLRKLAPHHRPEALVHLQQVQFRPLAFAPVGGPDERLPIAMIFMFLFAFPYGMCPHCGGSLKVLDRPGISDEASLNAIRIAFQIELGRKGLL
jgi:hypothetical protein